MMRTATIHVGTAALGCPLERSSTATGIGKNGKGATSVAPLKAVTVAALAAEVAAEVQA